MLFAVGRELGSGRRQPSLLGIERIRIRCHMSASDHGYTQSLVQGMSPGWIPGALPRLSRRLWFQTMMVNVL